LVPMSMTLNNLDTTVTHTTLPYSIFPGALGLILFRIQELQPDRKFVIIMFVIAALAACEKLLHD